ncbi:hypothetical protein SAMN05421553_1245 [Pseudomonas anguilliseptica]|uniref:Uncharacterized protein n=1 Tax=Pseudomonas anguilliseptica TaxID=53406 RepID=A0A1H4UEV3_PSEAG|nr:hypothetical protein SAMN05421553_1245 [Pseudomonas anguilliseptica]
MASMFHSRSDLVKLLELVACLVNPITHSELQPALLDARS